MDKNKKTPLLKKDLENEQNITNQDYPGANNAAPNNADLEESSKEKIKNVPEANDPVGYSEKGKIKESPYKK